MLKTKKLVILALGMMLVVSSVSGCSKANTGAKETATPTNAPSSSKASDLKPVELTWYFIGNGQQEDTSLIEAEANKYLKDKINATVKLQCYDWGSYESKLKTMIASRQEFDICFTASWSNNYKQQAAKGAFVNLNDLFDKYAPKTKSLLGADFLNGSKIDGVNYAIPANKEKAHQWGFLFKQDLVTKYNLDTTKVKKLEDLEPLLKTIKENEPNVYGLEALDGESPFKLLDFDQIGDDKYPGAVYNDSKDLKVFDELESPEAKAYFNTIHKYYTAGYIRKDAATVKDYNADEAAGKIFCATKSLKPGKDKEMSLTHKFEWKQVEITNPIISNRDTTGSMMAISSTSKNPERAMMFLELFNTDKYLNNLINFGIENKHYVKKGDNVITEGPENKKYNPAAGWMFGNQFINYLNVIEDPQKWDQFKAFNDKAKPTKTLSFTFDAEPVKNEIAACNNIWDKYVPALETGTVDPNEYLPKAVDEFKKAGMDKIIAEKQKQLDAWAAKNKK